MFKSICFQRVHRLSIVSRTCRRSQRATSIALWLPRRRQENDSEWHFRMNSCSVQLQLGNVSTADRVCQSQVERVFSASQMPFLQGADGPALHIKGGTWSQSEDRGSIALSDVLVVSKDMISRSVGAVSSLTVARHCTAMYTKSDSAIQLGYFLVDFLWMRCEQDLWKFFS